MRWPDAHPGPDARRYLLAATGVRMARPFHLRWLLPAALGREVAAWWWVWAASWPVAAGGMLGWRLAAGDGWQVAAAATVLLLGLPGILGPRDVIPVGVDLPATAVTLVGCLLIELGHPAQITAGVVTVVLASCIRETQGVWAAVWLWNPWPLIALLAPAIRHATTKRGPDPLGPTFDLIAAHPFSSALAHHRGRWRDGWVMVAPWGVCLAGLVDPSVQVLVAVAAAYGVLLVATDTVRLVHHAAGPVLAAAAASTIPPSWLVLACVAHVVWWWEVDRV